jgi:hypothetical protein
MYLSNLKIKFSRCLNFFRFGSHRSNLGLSIGGRACCTSLGCRCQPFLVCNTPSFFVDVPDLLRCLSVKCLDFLAKRGGNPPKVILESSSLDHEGKCGQEPYIICDLREALLFIHRSCLCGGIINSTHQFRGNCLIRAQGTFTDRFIQGVEVRKESLRNSLFICRIF